MRKLTFHRSNYLSLTCVLALVLMIFKSIFHKALNLFLFDYEIALESVARTNQY